MSSFKSLFNTEYEESDTGDLEWSPVEGGDEGEFQSDTEDYQAMDIDEKELDAEYDEHEEEDDDHINAWIFCVAYVKVGDTWQFVPVNHTRYDGEMSVSVSKYRSCTAYQIARSISVNARKYLPVELGQGFRIYLDETHYFQHNGELDDDGSGTGTLKELEHGMFDKRTTKEAREWYKGHGSKRFCVEFNEAFSHESGYSRYYHLCAILTPANVDLPTNISLKFPVQKMLEYHDSDDEDDEVYLEFKHVSPFFSLFDFHQAEIKNFESQKSKVKIGVNFELWKPKYDIVYCYKTPMVAFGISVVE